MAVTYISWAPHCSRSDYTARELGGVSHMVYWPALGSHPATVWLKYLGQAVRTWMMLFRDKPDAVFVMSPPVVAGVTIYPYCALRRIPFVIDAHTGAFLNPRWRWFQGLQYWLCRRATTTIVTNRHLASMLTAHGADATILPDVPVTYPDGAPGMGSSGFSVGVVCSFVYDEPVEVILDAVRALPDVRFLVTGDHSKAALPTPLPPNVLLTGFLDASAYGQLLRDVDVVLALTTARHTMLRAAYESIYQGTPIVVTDAPLLREEFPRGALFVDNTAPAIAAAVRDVRSRRAQYRQDARSLRESKLQRWESNKELLLTKIRPAPPTP